MECGRVQAVRNSTILQSDQEEHLIALLRATAAKMGGNTTVRQAPAYTSQAQGSVERFHRTLMGQIRTLKSQLQNNYDIRLTSKHPSLHGWRETQLTCSTGTPYTQMATQASSEDGAKNTKHHTASLVKQFFTCCQIQQLF